MSWFVFETFTKLCRIVFSTRCFTTLSYTAETRTVQRGRSDHILCRNFLYMSKVMHVYVPVQQFYVNRSRMITVVWKRFQFTKIYCITARRFGRAPPIVTPFQTDQIFFIVYGPLREFGKVWNWSLTLKFGRLLSQGILDLSKITFCLFTKIPWCVR